MSQPTALTGFVIHARPYQEKRAIYYLFSQEWGVVHGIGRLGLPSFALLSLFATGKNALKNFSQPTITTAHFVQRQYYSALLYLNEVLYKLLLPEQPCVDLWQVYQQCLDDINQLQNDELNLRLSLRRFERALFEELGVMPTFEMDNLGNEIVADCYYQFIPKIGFIANNHSPTALAYQGNQLLTMSKAKQIPSIYQECLCQFTQIQRAILDDLLEYKPLNSRKLWQQSQQFFVKETP